MIDKTQYRSFGDYIEYTPVAGPTIRQALMDGIEISQKENQVVHIKINDLTIKATKNSNIDVLVTEYYVKLEKRNQQPYIAAYFRGRIK